MKRFNRKGTATGSFRVVRTSKLGASVVPTCSLKEFFKLATPRLKEKKNGNT